MTERKYFILSILLAVLAIACQIIWLSHCSRSVGLHAKSITWSAEQKAQARIEADHILHRGQPYGYAGGVCAVAGFVLWLVSLRRHEPVWKSLPFVLLLCYLFILLFLMV